MLQSNTTSTVYCTLHMYITDSKWSSLWSDSESQLGQIREPSVTLGLQQDQKAEVGSSGSPGASEPMESS